LSRFLLEILGNNDPKTKQVLVAQERRSGHPNHDLRLTSKMYCSTRSKLKQLGLDPNDTTARELYFSLNDKLVKDDAKLTKKLRSIAAQKVNAEANISDGLIEVIKDLKLDRDCFALKSSVLKHQFQSQSPKRTMKALGYRSVDSLLKLEPVTFILLAINYYESESYLANFYARYKKLDPSCFELRKVGFFVAKEKKWLNLFEDIKKQTGLTLISNYETASVVLLPVSNKPEAGYSTMLLSKLLSEVSVILSVSSYLKLHQVDASFALKLSSIVDHEPYIDHKVLEQPVSWNTAQHALSSHVENIFAPHVSPEDLKPVNLLTKLGDVLEDLNFWKDCQFLAMVDGGQPISFNILDVASNLVNKLSFENRTLDHCRYALRQEIAKLYLAPELVVDSINSENEVSSPIIDNSVLS